MSWHQIVRDRSCCASHHLLFYCASLRKRTDTIFVIWMSDVSWTPEERNREGSNSGSGSGIWVYSAWLACVDSAPLLIDKDESGKLFVISLLGTDRQVDLPAVGPFNLFCRSSCYIKYEDEQHFLLWLWKMMESLSDVDASQESTTTPTSSSDERERSSKGEGDDVVTLDEDT